MAIAIGILCWLYVFDYFCFFSYKNYNTRALILVIKFIISNTLIAVFNFSIVNVLVATNIIN